MPGYTKDKQKIETRLRRIEGQVRGIQKMVAEDRYCIRLVEIIPEPTPDRPGGEYR